MNISPEQMRAFDAGAWDSFETRAVRHLRTYLMSRTSAHADSDLRLRIRSGKARARAYGFESERQIMCFIDTSYLLGEHFDTDPQYSFWTQYILTATRADPNRRAAVLLDRAQVVAAGRPLEDGVRT